MVYPFICAPIQCIHPHDDHEDEEEDYTIDDGDPFPPSPKKPRKGGSSLFRSKDHKNNPYANRGLDKFSAVLAELQQKRQQIYTQKGSEDISFVRFVFSDSNQITPVVVKARDRKKRTTTATTKPTNSTAATTTKPSNTTTNDHVKRNQESSNELGNHRAENKKGYLRNLKVDIWRPSYYLPVAVILIMVFLAMFGRPFAILCTSLGWYLVPTIKERSNSKQQPKSSKSRDYPPRASEKKMAYNGSGTLSFKGNDDNTIGGKKKTVTRRASESDASRAF